MDSVAEKWQAALGDLGLYEGVVIQVVSAMLFGGPLTLDLGGSHIALDRSLGEAIIVQHNNSAGCAGKLTSVIL